MVGPLMDWPLMDWGQPNYLALVPARVGTVVIETALERTARPS